MAAVAVLASESDVVGIAIENCSQPKQLRSGVQKLFGTSNFIKFNSLVSIGVI